MGLGCFGKAQRRQFPAGGRGPAMEGRAPVRGHTQSVAQLCDNFLPGRWGGITGQMGWSHLTAVKHIHLGGLLPIW